MFDFRARARADDGNGPQKEPGHRIAIVRHSAYPDDMHVRRDAMALRDAGFDVDLICDHVPGKPFLEHVDGITVVRIPPRHKRGRLGRYMFEYLAFPLLAAVVLLLRGLKRRYRWVEINNMPDWLIVAGLVPKLVGTQIVLYSREDMPRLFAADYDIPSTHPAIRLLRAIQLTCYRMADRIITTQELARHDLVVHGIAADKIVAVPNAPDEQIFLAQVSHPAVRPPRDAGLRLVTHGLMMRRYGIETLIEAVGLLRERIPDVRLEIIGEGEYRPSLEALVDHLNLRSAITFTGYLPDYESVAPRLLRADIGIVPIWTEFQLCNKLVDYLALGLPTITTASAALVPYLDDDAVCYVKRKDPTSLADAIEGLYLDPKRCAALGAAGHVAYEKHLAWESVRPTYLGIYSASDRGRGPQVAAPDREAVRAAR